MEKRKRIVMVVLSVVVCIMAIGYALLAQQLTINGTASIDSKWRIQITNITEKDIVGEAYSKVTPSYTAITANFNVGLIKPGDSITYDVEVSNLGTLKAKVDSINIATSDSDGIIYTVSGIEEGDKLAAGEKDILTIKVEYDRNATSLPEVTTKNITIIMNYVQDMEDVVDPMPDEPDPSISYDYIVGDQITFAGSNWYVINNSSTDEDYVTLMKEQVLTSSELGDYAAVYTCSSFDVEYGLSDCKVMGEKIKYNGLPYYWSDTCHPAGYYGYHTQNVTNCDGHDGYEESKVKEFLEDSYITALGTNNLKEVDGYKIRLLLFEEIQTNLGYEITTLGTMGDYYVPSENTPAWVYQDFGDVFGYWMIGKNLSGNRTVYNLVSSFVSEGSLFSYSGVRPVINLLKSSI